MPARSASLASTARAPKITSCCAAVLVPKTPRRPRSPAPASAKPGSSMRSNAPSNAIANCASPANASSTPIAVSSSTPSRRPFMGSFRYSDYQPHEEQAVTLVAFLEQPDETAVRPESSDEHPSELQANIGRQYSDF